MLIVRLGVILMIITAIASGGLALLNRTTAPVIAAYKAEMQAKARLEVMETVGGTQFEEVPLENDRNYWRAYDEEGNLVGYVGLAFGPGYSSTIETVAGYTTDFKIAGLKITFQQETPGLGTKAVEVRKDEEEPWFLRQFKGLNAMKVAVKQDRGQIDSITGATITSRAVANSVKRTAEMIREAVGREEVKAVAEPSASGAEETVAMESAAPEGDTSGKEVTR